MGVSVEHLMSRVVPAAGPVKLCARHRCRLRRKYRRWLEQHRGRRDAAETLLRTVCAAKGGDRAAEALQRLGDGGDTAALSDVQKELWALDEEGEEDEEEEEEEAGASA